MNKMKEYRITLVMFFAIMGIVLMFALVHTFILWLTKSNTLALQWGVFACVAIFLALLVDLFRKPKESQEPLSEDLKPKGFKPAAIPDEEALKDIPVQNRLDYTNVKAVDFEQKVETTLKPLNEAIYSKQEESIYISKEKQLDGIIKEVEKM